MEDVIKKALEALAQNSIYSYYDVEALYLATGSLDKTIDLVKIGSSRGINIRTIISLTGLNDIAKEIGKASLNSQEFIAKMTINSTPMGERGFKYIFEAATPNIETNTQQEFNDFISSNIDSMSIQAENLVNIAKAMRVAMSKVSLSADELIWYGKANSNFGDTESFANHYGTIESDANLAAGPKGVKLSKTGRVLDNQTDEGNPTGWYFLDNNKVLVFHLPVPAKRIITDFRMTEASLTPEGIGAGGQIIKSHQQPDPDDDWPEGPLPDDQDVIHGKKFEFTSDEDNAYLQIKDDDEESIGREEPGDVSIEVDMKAEPFKCKNYNECNCNCNVEDGQCKHLDTDRSPDGGNYIGEKAPKGSLAPSKEIHDKLKDSTCPKCGSNLIKSRLGVSCTKVDCFYSEGLVDDVPRTPTRNASNLPKY